MLLELSQRTGLGHGIHYLTTAELRTLDRRDDWSRTIDERRAHHRACHTLYLSDVLEIGDDLSGFGRPPRFDESETIAGVPVSPGYASGNACLLCVDDHASQTASGCVVVAATVDPQWLPWLDAAAALVLEQGGVLSHVAVLARRLGIPAVIVEGITHRVRSGDMLLVDGHRGVVRRRAKRLP